MEAEYLELISLNIWHIIVTIANLLLLTLILKKFLFKPVESIMAKRREQVEGLYQDAEIAKSKAEADRDLYVQKIRNAESEADAIIKKATLKADKLGDEIIGEAKNKAEDVMKKAEAQLDQEKKKAMNELKNEISTISVRVAESIVSREISDEDHRELIDSFIDKL